MPELPEVETTLRGITPHVLGQRVRSVQVRQAKLRWPIPAALAEQLPGQCIDTLSRRAKYLILGARNGHLLIHLGMSGSLRVVDANQPAGFHDHVDLELENGKLLRYRDPRRFGAWLWTCDPPEQHKLLKQLGPEPLSSTFDGDHLRLAAKGRRVAVKPFIMDGKVVVGVGNIYANEALFRAGIDPRRAAGRIASARYERLAECIKQVLAEAIAQGGSSIRDFVGGDGEAGYFAMQHAVYGRADQPCSKCTSPLREVRLGQRSTVYCVRCQS